MRVWTRVCPDIINLGHIQKAIHDYAQKALQAPTKNAKEGAVPSQRNPRTRFLKPGKREPPNPKANYCTGWVEAFPIWSKKAMDVCMSLLKETVPLFGIPKSFQSDNRPFFVAKIIQELEKPHRPEGRAQEHNSSFVELSRVQIQPCDSSVLISGSPLTHCTEIQTMTSGTCPVWLHQPPQSHWVPFSHSDALPLMILGFQRLFKPQSCQWCKNQDNYCSVIYDAKVRTENNGSLHFGNGVWVNKQQLTPVKVCPELGIVLSLHN